MKSKRLHDPMQRAVVADTDIQKHSCNAVSGELSSTICGAKTRAGSSCRNMPMKNGRCRMHGGGSTGPKTAAGIARQRAAVTIHGGRSREMREFRARVRELQTDARRVTEQT